MLERGSTALHVLYGQIAVSMVEKRVAKKSSLDKMDQGLVK